MGLDRESATSGSASLAPGFRFHPTDEELVRYYLKRKVCGKPFRFDAISDIDVYKTEPWDLPDKSRLKTKDLEWYFFSVLDKKYGNGSRTNRATGRGYWKTTGKDRVVNHRSRMVGMKKTLVYHSGRAPRGERTNWVMHEYRLVDDDLEKAGIVQDAFVLCRIFQKSGSGPKNGEQYGAPFIEEEWEDDDLVPGQEAAEAVAVCNDAFLDGNDLEQFLDEGITSEDFPVPLNFCYEHSSSHVQGLDYINDDQKPLICSGESFCAPEQPIDQWKFDLPVHDSLEFNPAKDEFVGESSNSVNNHDADYLLDEPFFDATGYNPFDDGAFLETNDLSNPIEADPSGLNMLEEYLTFFDAAEDNSQSMSFDSSKMMGSVNLAYDQESLAQKHANGGDKQDSMGSQQLVEGHNKDVASTSRKKAGNFGFDIQHPFIKQANRMLGSIPAPPAFASEFPTRGLALHLDSAPHSSSPVHVTASMIQIRNMLSEKAEAAISQGWCYMIFVWGFLMLSMSFKIGTCIYASNP